VSKAFGAGLHEREVGHIPAKAVLLMYHGYDVVELLPDKQGVRWLSVYQRRQRVHHRVLYVVGRVKIALI
jgi:hypothetical protein